MSLHREKNQDDVLQISNVFVNVSKGEVAKSNDLKKAFGTTSVDAVVKEVTLFPALIQTLFLSCAIDFRER